jgi:hypothetical protein
MHGTDLEGGEEASSFGMLSNEVKWHVFGFLSSEEALLASLVCTTLALDRPFSEDPYRQACWGRCAVRGGIACNMISCGTP